MSSNIINPFWKDIKIGDIFHYVDEAGDYEFISKLLEINESGNAFQVTDLVRLNGDYNCQNNQWIHRQNDIIISNFGNINLPKNSISMGENFKDLYPEYFI